MISDLDTLCCIQEQTSFEEDYKNGFGYEVHPSEVNGRIYITFGAILQSFGVKNRNGREYDAQNIWNCISTDPIIQDYLRRNCWLGEIDHPAPKKQGEELTINRIGVPDMKFSSHYIRSPRLNGNLLEAHIQTDSATEHGMNMAIKITDGKIVPCFSARVFGALQNKNGRPVVMVRKVITYDWVLYPSHPEAESRIKQPIMESVQNMEKESGTTIIFLPELARMAANNSKETEWLCESFGLSIDDVLGVTNTGNSVVVQENANVYVQPLTDRSIRKQTKSMLNDWLHR